MSRITELVLAELVHEQLTTEPPDLAFDNAHDSDAGADGRTPGPSDRTSEGEAE